MVSDFAAHQNGRGDVPDCKTYEYALANGQDESSQEDASRPVDASRSEDASRHGEAAGGADRPVERAGLVTLDFRKIASIHGYDPFAYAWVEAATREATGSVAHRFGER